MRLTIRRLLRENVILNLDSKYFLSNGEEIINLESIIIDSDDNIDITPSKESSIDNNKDDDKTQNSNNEGNNSGTGVVGDGLIGGQTGENSLIDFLFKFIELKGSVIISRG